MSDLLHLHHRVQIIEKIAEKECTSSCDFSLGAECERCIAAHFLNQLAEDLRTVELKISGGSHATNH
jgi:hypothetical protein